MSPSSLAARLFALVFLLVTFSAKVLSESPSKDLYYSYWYDWALYGVYPRQWYKSFNKGPPQLNFLQWSEQCDQGYTFMAPRGVMVWKPGPVIMDWRGELVWMEDKFGQAMDFKMAQYRGENYLTFWTGTDGGTFGSGFYYMLDSSYEVYKTIVPANNMTGDLHEFKVTEQGTALMTSYEAKSADLSPLGIYEDAWIYDSIFQEMDIETGELLFEWRASDHYPVDETYYEPKELGRKPEQAFDYFHINSIEKDDEGNYYISSRYMFTITKVSSKGEIIWILGGKRNYFKDLSHGAASNFSWQHDARWHGTVGNTEIITVFDNGKFDSKIRHADYSRGLLISLDVENWTATLIQDYVGPHFELSPSQGNVQLLPDTDTVLVGWGYYPGYTEFTSDGEALCDVHIGPELIQNLGWVKSYRAYRTSAWVGRPKTSPSAYLKPFEAKLYVSWNGATEVSSWLLQGTEHDPTVEEGETDRAPFPFIDISSVPKTKFETSIPLTFDMPTYIRVAAVDAAGEVLGYTEILNRKIGNAPFWDVASDYILLGGSVAAVALFLYYFYFRRRRRQLHILPSFFSSPKRVSATPSFSIIDKARVAKRSLADQLKLWLHSSSLPSYTPILQQNGEVGGSFVIADEEDESKEHELARLYNGD